MCSILYIQTKIQSIFQLCRNNVKTNFKESDGGKGEDFGETAILILENFGERRKVVSLHKINRPLAYTYKYEIFYNSTCLQQT